MYCRQFERVAANYLKSKVLEFDHWRESIKDRRKGDVMALLGLNYLMGTHTMVHLSGNRIGSTHRDNPPHDDIVNKCEFHLLYLGRGIYTELVKRDHPLVEVNELEGSKSLVVGTLSTVEDGAVNKLVHLGLGFGVDRTAETKDVKVSVEDTVPEGEPSTSSHGEIPPPLILKHYHLQVHMLKQQNSQSDLSQNQNMNLPHYLSLAVLTSYTPGHTRTRNGT